MNIEWELDEQGKRSGRWRRRQFYAQPRDRRIPSQRVEREWREGKPR